MPAWGGGGSTLESYRAAQISKKSKKSMKTQLLSNLRSKKSNNSMKNNAFGMLELQTIVNSSIW